MDITSCYFIIEIPGRKGRERREGERERERERERECYMPAMYKIHVLTESNSLGRRRAHKEQPLSPQLGSNISHTHTPPPLSHTQSGQPSMNHQCCPR